MVSWPEPEGAVTHAVRAVTWMTHNGDNIVNRNITQAIIMSSFSSSFSTQAIMVGNKIETINISIFPFMQIVVSQKANLLKKTSFSFFL